MFGFPQAAPAAAAAPLVAAAEPPPCACKQDGALPKLERLVQEVSHPTDTAAATLPLPSFDRFLPPFPPLNPPVDLRPQFERSKDAASLKALTAAAAPLVAALDSHPLSTTCTAPRADLTTFLALIKYRYDEVTFAPQVRALVIAETNRLYKDGLGLKVVTLLRNGVARLKETHEKDRTKATAGSVLDLNLRKAAEVLFFLYYGTQIEDGEVRQLVELIRALSEQLVDAVSSEPVEEWKTTVYAVLAIAQMTHVAALDQYNPLLLRGVDDPSPVSGDDLNHIKQALGTDLPWRSKGAKGLACLVNAVLRQPAVDNGEAPAADVVKLLIEASILRAYRSVPPLPLAPGVK